MNTSAWPRGHGDNLTFLPRTSHLKGPLCPAMPTSKPKEDNVRLLKAGGSCAAELGRVGSLHAVGQEMYGTMLNPNFIRARWDALAQQHGVGPQRLEKCLKKQKVGSLNQILSIHACMHACKHASAMLSGALAFLLPRLEYRSGSIACASVCVRSRKHSTLTSC